MSFQISLPEQFNIDQPENWAPWIRRYERYRLASKLNDESEKSQVNMLMYLLGDKADIISSSFRLNEEQTNLYDTVKQKFQEYFNVRHNVIYERAKCNLRKQEVSESVDDYLTSLHTLVETCNYGNQRWSPRGRPWPRGCPRGHILKYLALASKPQVLENCPVLGSKTALFLNSWNFVGKRQKPRGKFANTFVVFLTWSISVGKGRRAGSAQLKFHQRQKCD